MAMLYKTQNSCKLKAITLINLNNHISSITLAVNTYIHAIPCTMTFKAKEEKLVITYPFSTRMSLISELLKTQPVF